MERRAERTLRLPQASTWVDALTGEKLGQGSELTVRLEAGETLLVRVVRDSGVRSS